MIGEGVDDLCRANVIGTEILANRDGAWFCPNCKAPMG
jgi:hypothetical protein